MQDSNGPVRTDRVLAELTGLYRALHADHPIALAVLSGHEWRTSCNVMCTHARDECKTARWREVAFNDEIAFGWGADTVPSILDSQQQIKRPYDTFGPKRLMAGSDWPLVEKYCTYKQAIDIARNQIAFLSPEDKSWICGQTAQQVWRFEL
jgi:Amidohydrolase